MSRGVDWDKSRRQSKVWYARASSVDSFKPRKKWPSNNKLSREQWRRIQKARDLKHKLSRASKKHSPIIKPPAGTFHTPSAYRIVTVHLTTGDARACFRFRHGYSAQCVWADEDIEWFNRVRNMESISNWLFTNNLRRTWGPKMDQCPENEGQRTSNPSDDASAEAYPLKYASHPQGGNTGSSLNEQAAGADIPGSSMLTNEPQAVRSGMAYPVLAA